MGWNNLTVGFNEIHSVAKVYVNVVNAIANFVKLTTPANITTNETTLKNTESSRDSRSLERRARLKYGKDYSSFTTTGLSNIRDPKTSVMKSG